MSIERIYQDKIPIRRIYLNGKIVWQAKDEPVPLYVNYLAEHEIKILTDQNITAITHLAPAYDIALVLDDDGQYVATMISIVAMDAEHNLVKSEERSALLTIIDINPIATEITDLITSITDCDLTACGVVLVNDETSQRIVLTVSAAALAAESRIASGEYNDTIFDYISAKLATPLALALGHVQEVNVGLESLHTVIAALAVAGYGTYAHQLFESHSATAVPGYGVHCNHESDIEVLCQYIQNGFVGFATAAQHSNKIRISQESFADSIAADAVTFAHAIGVLVGQESYQLGMRGIGALMNHIVTTLVKRDAIEQMIVAAGLNANMIRDIDIATYNDIAMSSEKAASLRSAMVELFDHESAYDLTQITIWKHGANSVELFDHDSEYDLSRVTILSMGCDSICSVVGVDESYLSDRPDYMYPEQNGTDLYIPQVFTATQSGTDLYLS